MESYRVWLAEYLPLWLAIQLFLWFAIIVSSIDHAARGKRLLNMCMLRKIRKTNKNVPECWWCIFTGSIVTLILLNIFALGALRDMGEVIRAFAMGVVLAPYLHENRLTQWANKQVSN
jgi:uncharacterized membrane protein YobD (UPF0266 family)